MRNIIEEIENKFMNYIQRSKKILYPLIKSGISLKEDLWKVKFLVAKI